MAWIESKKRLAHHPKMFELSKSLNISRVQAIGHLFILWDLFSVFEKDQLRELTANYVAEISMWTGDETLFFSALKKCGWINEKDEIDFQGCAHVVYGKALRQNHHSWKSVRVRILSRDDFTCRYCGKKSPTMTVDHVIPVTRGGDHNDENLVAACRPCNSKKGNKIKNG
jgi:hypothetical protein